MTCLPSPPGARRALYGSLLQQPGAESPDFADQVDDILAQLAGTYRSAEGVAAHAVPGEGAEVELWGLGGSGGQSARVAGERGLPFAANYHVSPSTVLEAAEAYREAAPTSCSPRSGPAAESATGDRGPHARRALRWGETRAGHDRQALRRAWRWR
ncbi:hypothetical protein ABZV14_33375 [Streptosporangium canum]|uniref:hypothetical protein n=1 Tax=Streptosporangium canum TaxID=324952 RepID=UPI0033BD416F